MNHRIETIKFDIQGDNSILAKEIQDKIFSLCRYELPRMLDGTLSEFANSEQMDSLTLDVGAIHYSNLDSQLLPKLIAALGETLKGQSKMTSPLSVQPDLVPAALAFLEGGTLHWSVNERLDLNTLILSILDTQWKNFFSKVKSSTHTRAISFRLVENVSEGIYYQVIHEIRPTESAFLKGFIQDFSRSARTLPETGKDGSTKIDHWVRALVLMDLIKNHGTLFNRKMFVKRQLISMASHFRMSYSDLLLAVEHSFRHLDIPFQFEATFPALISELLSENRARIDDETALKSSIGSWEPLISGHMTRQEKYNLYVDWPDWIRHMSGDFRKSLLKNVKTSNQVESISKALTEDMFDELLTILEPSNDVYISDYKSHILKTNLNANLIKTSQTRLTQKINVFILTSILLERGSRFNRKQFLRSQIRQIGQEFRLNYHAVLDLLSSGLSDHSSNNHEPELFELLKELKAESFEAAPKQSVIAELDAFLLLKEYLTIGTLDWTLGNTGDYRTQIKAMVRIFNHPEYRDEILVFLTSRKSSVLRTSHSIHNDIFLMVIRLLLDKRTHLGIFERDQIFDIIREQAIGSASHSFKTQILEKLIDFRSLERADVLKFGLDQHERKKGSLEYSYFKAYLQEKFEAYTPVSTGIPHDDLKSRLLSLLLKMNTGDSGAVETRIQLKKLLEQLLKREGESRAFFLFIGKQHFQVLLSELDDHTLTLLIGTLVRNFPRFKIATTLYDSIPSKRERASFLTEIFVIFQQSFFRNTLVKSLPRKLAAVRKKYRLSPTVNTLFLPETEVLSADYFLSQFEEVLYGRNQDASISSEELQAHIHRWYATDNKRFISLLRSGHFDSSHFARWSVIFREDVLVRLLQIYVGIQFNLFMTTTKNIEFILYQGLKKTHNEKFALEQVWSRRLRFAFLFGSSNIEFDRMVRLYLRELAGNSKNELTMIEHHLSDTLPKLHNEIRPPALAKKVDRLLDIIKAPTVDEPPLTIPKKEDKSEEPMSYSVHNAGIVLLWPYYRKLFEMLGFLSEDALFHSPDVSYSAVRLLQFIATGNEKEPEYELILNKVLCGLPLNEHVPTILDLTTEQTEITLGMIEGAIRNWGKLGDTSIEGFRNSFLRRSGSLRLEDGEWTLQVEKKGMDVLLDSIPWGYSSIKLPWMQGALYVSWR